MKKNILIGLFCCFAVLETTGQGINFFRGSFEEALKKAQQENKQLFVDVYTSWCGPCKMMAKEVFTRPEVGRFFNTHFVSLQLDAEKEKASDFFRYYQAGCYPSFFWLDSTGKILDIWTGYTEAEKFIEVAKQARESDLNQRLEEGRKRWETGERSVELLEKYVFGVLAKIQPDTVQSLVLEYLGNLSEEQLKSFETYKILQRFMRNAEDNLAFRTLIKNASVYSAYDPTFWNSMYRMVVRAGMILREDREKFQDYRNFLSSLKSPLSEMYLEIIDMELALFQEKYKQGLQQAMNLVERYRTEHPYLAEEFFYTLIIAHYFERTPVRDELVDRVITLAEQALKSSPSQQTLLYSAVAYAHQENYKRSYELLASMPFFPKPILSNALYPALKLPVIHREYLKKENSPDIQ